MNLDTRLELSYYSTLSVVNEAHKIFIVQHVGTQKIYIKKVMDVYNADIYLHLRDHPVRGLPRIFLVHEEEEQLTVIEEYVTGETLEERLSSGPLREEQTARYARKLCRILDELHSQTPPIVHRDIKPSNIMITPNDDVVLLDMNAAKCQSDRQQDTVLLGTYGYAAPEQYGFGSSGPAADIYALGQVMNTCLWGEFRRELWTTGPLAPVLARCTRLDPKQRYADVRSLKDALDEVLGLPKPKNPAAGSARAKYAPPGFRQRNLWHAIFGLLIYALMVWIAVMFEPPGVEGVIYKLEKCFFFLMELGVGLIAADYFLFAPLIPSVFRKHRLVRWLAKAVLASLYIFLMTLVMMILENMILS